MGKSGAAYNLHSRRRRAQFAVTNLFDWRAYPVHNYLGAHNLQNLYTTVQKLYHLNYSNYFCI